MSMFICDHCGNLIDSDDLPEIEYDETTDEMKCQICIESENDDK